MYKKINLITSIFRIYQEKKTRQLEFEQQYNRIKDQLRFENENDIESKFSNNIFVNTLPNKK